MGKKSKRKEKKDKKPKEIGEWNQMERFLLTQDVMGKLKELGVGVYVEQCNELEEIINNYVTKKEECKKIIDKDVNCKEEYFWGLIMWKPSFNNFISDKDLHFGTSLNRAIENINLKQEKRVLESKLFHSYEIVGKSNALEKVKNLINKLSNTESRVFISGPAGSGKELVARQIHKKIY